jgi:hypothetical protein
MYLRTNILIAQESCDILLHCSRCADSYIIESSLFTIALLGCYFSLKDYDRTQKLLDKIPGQLDKRKLSGRDMPTEAFIKKKCSSSFIPILLTSNEPHIGIVAFYKRKQARLGGDDNRFVEAIKISPAEGSFHGVFLVCFLTILFATEIAICAYSNR